jgi:succinate dehydrogenase / fumarate reductase membrane anchor subunit
MVQATQGKARFSGSLLPRRAPYITIRVTGVLLAVLALGHFAVTHVVNDVSTTGSSFIARRWGSALWVVWDGLLLAAALLHASAGLLAVVRDYRTRPVAQRRWLAGLGAFIFTIFVIGMVVLVYSALGAAR